MTSECTNLSVCANQLCGMSGTTPSFVQLLPGQGQDGPGDPTEASQPPKLHLPKAFSSHFSVTYDT